MSLRATLLSLLSIPAVLSAGTDYTKLLPKETILYVAVNEPAKLRALGSHAVFRDVRAPVLSEAMAKMLESALQTDSAKRWKEETGMEFPEVLEKFTGGIGGGFYADKFPAGRMHFALAAEFSGSETMAEKLASALASVCVERLKAEAEAESDDAEENAGGEEDAGTDGCDEGAEDEAATDDGTGEFESDSGDEAEKLKDPGLKTLLAEHEETKFDEHGATVHVWKPKAGGPDSDIPDDQKPVSELAWCVREGLLLVASGEQAMRDLLTRAAATDSTGSLGVDSDLGRTIEQAGRPDACLAANLRVLLSGMTDNMSGMDKLNTVLVSLDTSNDAVDLELSLTWDSVPKLAQAFRKQGDPKAHKFIPPDVLTVSAAAFDIAHSFREGFGLLSRMVAGGTDHVRRGMDEFEHRTGVDITGTLLPALGSGYFHATKVFIGTDDPAREELSDEDDELLQDGALKFFDLSSLRAEGAVVGIAVEDEKIIGNATAAAVDASYPGATAEREYMGATIRVFKHPEWSGAWLAWTIRNGWLLVSVGRHELLESIIGRMDNPDDNCVFKRRDVIDGFASMPEGEIHLSYVDLERAAEEWLLYIAYLVELAAGDFFEATADEEMFRGVDFPVNGFSKTYMDEKGLRSCTRLMAKPGSD